LKSSFSVSTSVLVLLAATWPFRQAASQETLPYADLAKRMTDLTHLAALPQPGEKCSQCSSYDRASKYDEKTGKYVGWDANGDGGGIIRREGDLVVMAEMEGPGCISRIWSAAAQKGHVKIYLDGAVEPAVDLPFADYFDGKHVPFNYPSLSYNLNQQGCSGQNLYLPIPYQKSCKIVAEKGWGSYYHFTYDTFPKGTKVPTFSAAMAAENAAALTKVDGFFHDHLGEDPAGTRDGEETLAKTISLAPGQTVRVAELSGPRAITALKVKMQFKDRNDEMAGLRKLALRATWDGQSQPAVWSPLGDFFGTAPGVNYYKSLSTGMTNDGFYAYWYMPFAKSALVELVNDDAVARQVEVKIVHAPLGRPFDGLGHFHAKWHRDTFTLPKDRWPDWVMLRAEGRGRFCGVMLHVWNPLGGWWGEGDEKFFVDGEKFPSTFGTGSEDYFGYAWCNPNLFQTPYHCQTMTQSNKGHQSLLRWHIADNVPFSTSFEGCIEKYFGNQERGTLYACLACWYLAPGGVDPYDPVPADKRDGYYAKPEFTMVAGLKVFNNPVGLAATQDMKGFPSRKWPNNEQLWWTGTKPGAKLELAVPLPKPGTYELSVILTKAKDYGIVQFHLDGKKIGEPIDLYNLEVVPTEPISLGVHSFGEGPHKLTVEMVGANPRAAKVYYFGISRMNLKVATSNGKDIPPVLVSPSPQATAAPLPVLEITENTTLDPAKTYGRIVIKASNIQIDGRGAWLVGPAADGPSHFQQTAISAKEVSGVTLRNVNAKGWAIGLSIEDGKEWRIEECNFSDNFHDPAFGWGEQGRRGGMVLQQVTKSVVRKNRANRVWDGCSLIKSDDNVFEENDFSRTSNTCLKLWNSSRNTVRKNLLTHGIRINPGETHARDSSCVLIETNSNDNQFLDNDCTHGGDGIFIRVLNGWVSTGNLFERNDASHANNNCFEAWAPRNIYRNNKANHASYGFWLGASDQTLLEGNEVSYNGGQAGFRGNSPHLPGSTFAGIVFMFGPSSHTIVRGNKCVGNNGAGIALIGDLGAGGPKWKASHWIIDQNLLKGNRWGIYAKHADWIDVAANQFADNRLGNVFSDGGVTNLVEHAEDPKIVHGPRAVLRGPASAKVGESVAWDASASTDPEGLPLRFRWNLGDGTVVQTANAAHAFKTPGFYRLGLTVNNGLLSDLAWRDFYVVDNLAELATEGHATDWAWIDPQSRVAFADDREVRIAGRMSLRAEIDPYGGGRVNLLYPASRKAGISLRGKKELVFWLKAQNENVKGWQSANPIVTIHESDERRCMLTPKADLLSRRPNNEEREGWSRFVVPLAGDGQWTREGDLPEMLNYLTIGFDSWGGEPLRIWIDGLGLL